MNVVRNEIRTGLLVLLTLAGLVGILIYLGAPGVFTKQKQFGIYFDNAAGIKEGTPVMYAGRQIGRVTEIVSPVSMAERPKGLDGKPLLLEVRITVRVDQKEKIYNLTKVSLATPALLGEPVIDFTRGDEASGLAEENKHFVGERPGGLADTGTQIIEKLEPAINQLVTALQSLEKTANNLTALTSEGADLPKAFAEIRKLAENLSAVTGPGGSFRKTLDGLDKLAGENGEVAGAIADFRKLINEDSNFAKALANAQKFTHDLSDNKDLPTALKNFRAASEKLNGTISSLSGELNQAAENLSQATDLVKREPWRMIWKSTKKYPEGEGPPPKKATPTPAPKKRRSR
jgi:ABC-type transporter Mla subunit MlaD